MGILVPDGSGWKEKPSPKEFAERNNPKMIKGGYYDVYGGGASAAVMIPKAPTKDLNEQDVDVMNDARRKHKANIIEKKNFEYKATIEKNMPYPGKEITLRLRNGVDKVKVQLSSKAGDGPNLWRAKAADGFKEYMVYYMAKYANKTNTPECFGDEM